MMRQRLFTIALAIGHNVCLAVDPVNPFVQDLLQSRGNNVWFVEEDQAGEPKGGYVYRFDLDVDGDGKPEAFVGTSLDADRKGEYWSIFRIRSDGAPYMLKKSFFMARQLRVKNDETIRKYSFYIPQKEAEGGSYFGSFWLDDTGGWHEDIHFLSDEEQATMDGRDADTQGSDGSADEEKIADKLGRGREVKIDIKKVLLSRYLQDSEVIWRNINQAFALAQQYKDPDDASDIALVADWVPPNIP